MQNYGSKLPPLDRITVLGVAIQPSSVVLNGKAVTFSYNSLTNSLLVGPGLQNPLTQPFVILWK